MAATAATAISAAINPYSMAVAAFLAIHNVRKKFTLTLPVSCSAIVGYAQIVKNKLPMLGFIDYRRNIVPHYNGFARKPRNRTHDGNTNQRKYEPILDSGRTSAVAPQSAHKFSHVSFPVSCSLVGIQRLSWHRLRSH